MIGYKKDELCQIYPCLENPKTATLQSMAVIVKCANSTKLYSEKRTPPKPKKNKFKELILIFFERHSEGSESSVIKMMKYFQI